ncbi:protein MIZU-KUSSEI 1-like [Dioscorea cayenensis subsp. rotundata]|uniref:Protein MIZU-KUSSEI 1-like n=1 Tax=Dioscorea cayennensis subsp. rotundata TaxID=55577 RepID=A0AB40CBT6_DIOCR|nr:protein MIZU-KUSSEI 1-like [Dioscorea cayenensis subsp. rotundata]
MKVIDNLRRFIAFCLCTGSPDDVVSTSTRSTINERPSSSLLDIFKDRAQEHNTQYQEDQEDQEEEEEEEEEEEDSLIDPSAACHHRSQSPRRSLVVGTLYGHRRGHVSFCVQSDPAVPPPFLYEISVPTALLAREMSSGFVRMSLECSFASRRSTRCGAGPVWKAYCNGRKVGYAVRRKPSEKDLVVVQSLRSVSAGAGVMLEDVKSGKGEVMYVRASYERVVGSRDSVSYHLINPGGSPSQELSVFLLRNRHRY